MGLYGDGENVGFEDAAQLRRGILARSLFGTSLFVSFGFPCGRRVLLLHSFFGLMCGIFEADVLLHVQIPMFRFAAHGVTEMQPLRGYAKRYSLFI